VANRLTAWCIDCKDPNKLAAFWTAVLDWVVIDSDREGVSIKPSADAGWGIDFFVVPDGPKRDKNRVHLDVNPTDRDQDAELQRLLELGAPARRHRGKARSRGTYSPIPRATSSVSFAAVSSRKTLDFAKHTTRRQAATAATACSTPMRARPTGGTARSSMAATHRLPEQQAPHEPVISDGFRESFRCVVSDAHADVVSDMRPSDPAAV
jgi:hypothetical protein